MLAKIRRMYFRDKVPLRKIARQTGLSRNTLRHWLRENEMREPAYPPRTSPSILDPYKDQLASWLRTDSHRPKRDRRTAKVLFQLIQAQGYPGGYARVAIFAKQWREAGGARPARQAFIPLRFAPGEAFQFDWSCEYAVIAGMRRRLEVAHIKLAHSRVFLVVAYPLQTHEMLFDAHAQGFAAWADMRHPECPDLTLLSVLEDEQPHLMPNPQPFDGYIEQPVRVSATSLIHYQRSRYSVPAELAHQVISLRVYPWELVLVAEDEEVARHRRCFERYQTVYDWQHYVGVLQRKPGALRNGAPFSEMPERLKTLQRHLLRHEGGDRVMAQVLAAVVSEGLEPVLVAVELALESGNISGDHVLNVLARLQSPVVQIKPVETSLMLSEEPQANVHRYDHLRALAPEEVNDVE